MPNPVWQKNTLAEVSIIGVALGQQIINVFTFEMSGALELLQTGDLTRQAACQSLTDDWITNLKTTWLATHTPDYRIDMVRGQVMEVKNYFRRRLSPTERAQTTSNVGTATGTAEELGASAVVKWRSTVAGKSHRGRTYLGPLSGSWVADGRLTTPATTAITTWAQAMKSRYHVGGTPVDLWLQTVYSRPYNQGEYGYPQGRNPNRIWYYPPEYAGDSTNCTDFGIDPIVRMQRRRQIGVGA